MSTPTGQWAPPPRKQRSLVHERINRTLTTIALLLSILLMGLLLYAGAEAYYKYLQVQEALSGIGAAPVVEQPLEDEIREPEVRDTGQDLSPFIGSTLGVPIDDGTVCAEDGNINAIVCEGPNADNGELFWNGVVIED